MTFLELKSMDAVHFPKLNCKRDSVITVGVLKDKVK